MRKLTAKITVLAVVLTCLVGPATPQPAVRKSSSEAPARRLPEGMLWPPDERRKVEEDWEATSVGTDEQGLARLVKDINTSPSPSNPSSLTAVGGTLFFTGNEPTTGQELWKSDGRAEGTLLVQDIFAGSGSSTRSLLINVGGTLFFIAGEPTTGRELWVLDGP
jgi:ELWxxDGT repeat protein